MRLYLSSFRFGNDPQKIVELVGNKGGKTAAIMNARDAQPVEQRAQRCNEELQQLQELGFNAEELDLRDYFDKPEDLAAKLTDYRLLWLSGGNVFVLRLAMKLSGFDTAVLAALQSDSLVYAGYSAAGCVLAPSLQGYEIVDDPDETAKAYQKPADYSGLGVLDYYFEPHYKSDHPESAKVDREIAYLQTRNVPYKTLRDGEAIIVNGSQEAIISL